MFVEVIILAKKKDNLNLIKGYSMAGLVLLYMTD